MAAGEPQRNHDEPQGAAHPRYPAQVRSGYVTPERYDNRAGCALTVAAILLPWLLAGALVAAWWR
jgi:hypothetical protein